MGDISEKDISGKDIYWVPLLIRGNRMGTLDDEYIIEELP